MREIAISEFKTACSAIVDEVCKTGVPVRITRFGAPVADVVAPRRKKTKHWLGCMEDSVEILGDIVGPIGALAKRDADRT